MHYRSKITLTEHQLSIAQDRLPEFRNLNVEERAKMIQQVTNKVKCSWSESQPKFDRKQVENVRAISANPPNRSYISLDCPPMPIQRRQTAAENYPLQCTKDSNGQICH